MLRRDSSFAGTTGGGGLSSTFFPLLTDPASIANEKERAYYMREEEKIYQTVAQMEKCQLLTDQMLTILDSFDEKLSTLESSMLPIHKGTQGLTTAQKNIDSTLAETDKIILHYSIATESEESINSHLINSIDYVSYLEWVEKIHESIHFFAKNKERLQHGSTHNNNTDSSSSSGGSSSAAALNALGLHSNDFEKYLKKLKELNKRVMNECEGEFERVLQASSKNPLDLSRTGWPLPMTLAHDGATLISFQVVPELSVKELSALATRMAIAGDNNYFGILLRERSGFIRSSLKKIFHEEVKFSVNPASTPSSSNSLQLPQQQIMHIRGSIIQATTPSSGGMPFFDPMTPSGSSSSSSTQLYQKNTHRSVFYLDYFLKLLELEHVFLLATLSHIFNPEEARANGLPVTAVHLTQETFLGGGSHAKVLSGSSSTAFSHSMSLANLTTTSATTGNLAVFHGQEAYDNIFSNIVESPLEYFKKKIEQNTYLKDGVTMSKLSSVFSIGGKENTSSAGSSGPSSSSSSSTSLSLGATLSNKILILLDVLEHLNALLPRYRIILKRHSQFERMTDFQAQIVSLTRKSIQEYREYMLDYVEKPSTTAGKTKSSLKDGTIYTLTVETLNFIKRLYEYRRVIEHTTTLVDKHYQGQQAEKEKQLADGAPTVEIGERFGGAIESGESPLTRLVSFLLSGLESNMESKAKGFKLASLSAIFLLNNFHYASRFLKKNEATFLSPGSGNLQATVERYDKLVHTTMKQYRTVSWEKIVAHTLNKEENVDLAHAYASAATGSSAYNTARKAIKNRFAFFNTAFDELYHSQRYFSIPDSDLRSQLRNDNVELIIADYKRLYDTFTTVNFSRNPAKYMKYQPHVVEKMINQFFDETTI